MPRPPLSGIANLFGLEEEQDYALTRGSAHFFRGSKNPSQPTLSAIRG